MFTATIGRDARAAQRVQGLRHDFFACSMLARDQNIRVGRPDARDRVQHRLHRGSSRDELGPAFRAKQAILGFEAGSMLQSAMQFDLSA